jgi:hypothetical protein
LELLIKNEKSEVHYNASPADRIKPWLFVRTYRSESFHRSLQDGSTGSHQIFAGDSTAISINNAPITMFSPWIFCTGNVYFETSKGVGIFPIKNR